MLTRNGSMFTTLAWLIVIGFAVMQVASFFYWGHERMLARAQTFAASTVDRTVALINLEDADIRRLNAITGEQFQVELVAQPPTKELAEATWPHNDEIGDTVINALKQNGYERAEEALFAYSMTRRQLGSVFQLVLPAGNHWIVVRAKSNATRIGHDRASFGFMLLLFAVVAIAVLLATRRMTRYLSALASSAEGIGTNQPYSPLPTSRGPSEVRRAASAFNDMQARVSALIRQRTQMLAAMSHDLRTIATRLGMRADGIADFEQRQRAKQDLTEMTVILDEAMAFAKDDATSEEASTVDLASMLQSICEDQSDLGNTATFVGDARPYINAQPVAIKRALSNLVDNAVRYGGSAEVALDQDATVRITDPGPGMTAEELAHALEPFTRLEQSRNRTTGGTGLGLATAHAATKRQGGELDINKQPNGFVVTVRFPSA